MSATILVTTLVGFPVSNSDFYTEISSVLHCPKKCITQGEGSYCSMCGSRRRAHRNLEATNGYKRLWGLLFPHKSLPENPDYWGDYLYEHITPTQEGEQIFLGVRLSALGADHPKSYVFDQYDLARATTTAASFRKALLGPESPREIKATVSLYVKSY